MKKILTLFLLYCASIGSIFALPAYYPNYKIDAQLENIIDILVEIKALKATGGTISTSKFSSLNKNFKAIFPYFPQTPNYKLVYKQCEITTKNLSSSFSQLKLMIFMDNCANSLNTILKSVDQDYSVKSKIVVTATE
jgi:hypothetical protein